MVAWYVRQVPGEVHVRHPDYPQLRLDITRTEAVDLLRALGEALSVTEPHFIDVSPWRRVVDWFRQHTWGRADEKRRIERIGRIIESRMGLKADFEEPK